MNHIRHSLHWCLALTLAASFGLSAVAAPGAHGPNGEHLDGPAAAGGSANASPRMESKSEAFELVATLGGGELSMLIDRFETNEPVLNARVEVESGKLKATAKFHADHGDYAVDDPALLQALMQPGSHPIVVTVIAANDTDLLEGTLAVTEASANAAKGQAHDHGDEHGHEHAAAHGHDAWLRPTLIIAAFALVGGAGFWWQRRQRRAAAVEMSQ
jgi:hypothetical protein